MTNKEAIEVMSLAIKVFACSDKYVEAIDLAIKALEQMDSCPVFSDNEVKQPCLQSPCIGPKKGKWILRHYTSKSGSFFNLFECSECGKEYSFKYDFCPICGADMREADND